MFLNIDAIFSVPAFQRPEICWCSARNVANYQWNHYSSNTSRQGDRVGMKCIWCMCFSKPNIYLNIQFNCLLELIKSTASFKWPAEASVIQCWTVVTFWAQNNVKCNHIVQTVLRNISIKYRASCHHGCALCLTSLFFSKLIHYSLLFHNNNIEVYKSSTIWKKKEVGL